MLKSRDEWRKLGPRTEIKYILGHLSKMLYEAKTKGTQLASTLRLPASLNMSSGYKTTLGEPDRWTTGTISILLCLILHSGALIPYCTLSSAYYYDTTSKKELSTFSFGQFPFLWTWPKWTECRIAIQ